MDEQLYMSAEEAAAALGVSVTTIYAYVSRKMLRSHKPAGARVARYWRADVERVRQKLPASHREADALVSSTQITIMTAAGPFYRGRSAVALSETGTLESAAALLWQVDADTVFPSAAPPPSLTVARLLPSLEGLTAIEKALAAFPIVERENPRAYDLSPAGFARTAAESMRWFAALMVGADAPSSEPLHVVASRRAPERAVVEDLVRRLLVLSADHELDPTTYAVRAVANAGINPYRLALSGLIASAGRRLAYGRLDTLGRLLEDLARSDAPQDVIVDRLREGEALPGFGTRLHANGDVGRELYPLGDPRAVSLLTAMDRALDGDPEYARLHKAIATARELTGLEPSFALVNLFLGRKLGLSRQDGIALRLGRMAGWMAHAMEQYHGQELVRPHAAYVGPLPSI